MIQLPCVNWNGTSRNALLEGYMHALRAIEDAMAVLRTTAPNGRDYQTLPDPGAALERAIIQHHARLETLHGVRQELNTLAESVAP